MAHIIKSQTIVGIPITIVLRSSTCRWEIGPNLSIWILDLKSGKPRRAHPQAFCEIETDQPAQSYFDPWKLREWFLSLRTEQDFLKFLNETGRLGPRSANEKSVRYWEFTALQTWQRLFGDFLTHSPMHWEQRVRKFLLSEDQSELVAKALDDASTLPIQFRWHGKQHSAYVEVTDVVTAIVATICLDHLRETKYLFCARPDCRKPFEVTSKHKRKYCTLDCAHLESVRRMRRRKRKSTQKPI